MHAEATKRGAGSYRSDPSSPGTENNEVKHLKDEIALLSRKFAGELTDRLYPHAGHVELKMRLTFYFGDPQSKNKCSVLKIQ